MTVSSSVTSRAGRVWAWVPALLLGAMLAGLGTLVTIAVDDPHFALEPNYYDKAVHWDRARAEAAASQTLGLQLAVPGELRRSGSGQVELEFTITARDRAPFAGAVVELEAFPNAFRSHTQRLTLREAAPGVYRGRLEPGALGLWELRVAVSRGGQRFYQTLRRDVTKGGAA
jgi:hypothetical protein